MNAKDKQPAPWIRIDKAHPLPENQAVIAYNKEWIDDVNNPSGTRIGFLNSIGDFVSARWTEGMLCYETCLAEGDDYEATTPDGKHYYWKNGEPVEGYRPNMPTHYMLIPATTDIVADDESIRQIEA